MSESGGGVIGTRLRKVDGIKRATGEARYTDDLVLPRMLFARMKRSVKAHARIVKIDVAPALAIPGVVAILTGDRLPAKYGVIPWTHDEQALCTDKVRFIGDELACVAAVDERTAEEGVRAIRVEYEELPVLLTPEEALAHPEVQIHEGGKKGNVTKHVDLCFGEVDAALAAADVLVDEQFFYEGSTHAPIEPHCALADYGSDGQLTVWSSTQIPHYVHRELSRVLGLPEAKVRVIQPALGGAFGGKSDPFSLEFCAARLSMDTGRPVKILWTREELFFSHRGRHPMKMRFRVAAGKDGKLSAVDSKILIDGGAYASFGLVTAYYAGQLLTGPYAFPTYRFDATRVYTNKPPCGPKRGHGSVQPRFAFEVALDLVAEKLALDPIEIRRRNFIGEHVTTVNGQRITSNGFLGCLDAVEKASGWKERYATLPRGKGLGVAGSMYISGTAYPVYPNELPQSGIQVKLDRSGRVTVFSGASDIGQGSNSVPAYILAEELGCLPDDVTVVASDTDLTPVDLGAYSSRVTFMMGNACLEAARRLSPLLRGAVAAHLSKDAAVAIPPEEISLRLGTAAWVREPSACVSFREAVQLAEAAHGTLGATGSYRTQKLGGDYRGGTIGASPAYSFTAHVAEVEVDERTGRWRCTKIWAAHDCGRALNPVLVEGQIEGSVYMGFAEAAMEEMRYHDGSGTAPAGLHRGPSLLDYRIPTSLDTPEIFASIVESHDPEGPYGAKEAGEGPLHPAIPAVANAIWKAVGVRPRSLPFRPAELLAALKSKARATAAAEPAPPGAAAAAGQGG